MASASSKRRKYWKEYEPQKYQAYLEQNRLNNKRSRDKKKKKWAENVHTREMEQEQERERMLKRERDKRCREKKRAEAGQGNPYSKSSRERTTSEGKRRREMTAEERRRHDNRVRAEYFLHLSHERRALLRMKNRDRMRAAREKKGLAVVQKSLVEGTLNMVKRLIKTKAL